MSPMSPMSPIGRPMRLLLWASVLLSATTARAQSWQIGVGPTRLLDTYLSQEHFEGTGLTLLSSHEYTHRPDCHQCANRFARLDSLPPRRWTTIVENQLHLSSADDRAGNESIIEGDYHVYAGRYRRWFLLDGRLQLQAGALGALGMGFIYDMRNGNNPANARLSLQLMPSAIATWHFQLCRQMFQLRWRGDMTLCGLAFSPRYGQSYYEMFQLGKYDRNIVATTVASQPCFRQQLTLAWRMSRRCHLTVGLLGDYQQLSVNHLRQHVYSERFMIGIVTNR